MDRSSIKIHHDNWIPRSGCLRPLGQAFLPGTTKVAHLLLDQANGWDEAKVAAMFSPSDARDILQIAVGGVGVEDYQAWYYTKNGIFNVKSAYHLAMSRKLARAGQPGSSSSVQRHKGYLGIWSTNAPGKAKIHMWRLVRNGLAVGSELHRRWIKPGVSVWHAAGKKPSITGSGHVNIRHCSGRSCIQRRASRWHSRRFLWTPRMRLQTGSLDGLRRRLMRKNK